MNTHFHVMLSSKLQSGREFSLLNEIAISDPFHLDKPIVILVSLNDYEFGTQRMEETLENPSGDEVKTLSNTLGFVYSQQEGLNFQSVR